MHSVVVLMLLAPLVGCREAATQARPLAAAPRPSPLAPADPEATGRVPTMGEERRIGDWMLRVWHRSEDSGGQAVISLDRLGRPPRTIDGVAEILDGSGRDLSGDGHPDLVLLRYSGGMHCCFQTEVHDLGPEDRLLLRTPASSCPARPTDIDGDGSLELRGCDDAFAYRNCSFAASPLPVVILAYDDAASGFVSAGPHYAPWLLAELRRADERLTREAADAGPPARCALLDAVVTRLYLGREAEGWSLLERSLPAVEADGLRDEIGEVLAESPLYPRPVPRVVLAPALLPQTLDGP